MSVWDHFVWTKKSSLDKILKIAHILEKKPAQKTEKELPECCPGRHEEEVIWKDSHFKDIWVFIWDLKVFIRLSKCKFGMNNFRRVLEGISQNGNVWVRSRKYRICRQQLCTIYFGNLVLHEKRKWWQWLKSDEKQESVLKGPRLEHFKYW